MSSPKLVFDGVSTGPSQRSNPEDRNLLIRSSGQMPFKQEREPLIQNQRPVSNNNAFGDQNQFLTLGAGTNSNHSHNRQKSAMNVAETHAAMAIPRKTSMEEFENNPIIVGALSEYGQSALGKNASSSEDSDDEGVSLASSEMSEDYSYLSRSCFDREDQLKKVSWKPKTDTTYETLMLTSDEFNSKVRGAGFQENNRPREFVGDCHLSEIRRRCVMKEKKPAFAICITMYNEDEQELKNTLKGIVHNYNCFRAEDERYGLTKDDFNVTIICDGYDRIPEEFKQNARDKGFLDEELLVSRGYMSKDDKGVFKMRDLKQIMDPSVPSDQIPSNLLHVWQVTTWDLGLEEDVLKGRRMHIMFAVKHRNDGKINSHKWFFQAICKYLKPKYCLMLDIGTQMDKYALLKLYAHMEADQNCGGCCGEIEVDLETPNEGGMSTWLLQAAQFYEYKLGHTPDKACESFFGFTQVLPGAYSLFRWKAIKGDPLEAFFKSVTRNDTPTCAEANEYLAEDRIMCLQIYIKKLDSYTLSYVPDAKAFTDAPQSMTVLMKQRRRWMNGAMFGTAKVLSNFVNMVSCKRTSHGCVRKTGILLFMFYLSTLFLLQFFIVGAMFAAIYAFFDQVFASIFASNAQFNKLYYDGVLLNAFVYVYIMLLAMCLIISLALPLDRAKPCFVIAITLFGAITIAAIVGMMFYLSAAGFMPEHMTFDQYSWTWTREGDHHFSWLVLAGVIMLAVYTIPFLLRPIDFLENFKGYTLGLFAYLLLIPMFTNIFTIYAMCNLHDLSWGNRPTTATLGTELVASKAKDQREAALNYKTYRANFLFLWFCANGAYFVLVLELGNSGDQYNVNSGIFTVLDGFSMYLASIVIFRVIFALMYVLKWQCRYAWNRKYQVDENEQNLDTQFRRLKKNKDAAESSDDAADREALEEVRVKREKTLKKRSKRFGSRMKKMSNKEKIEMLKRLVIEEDIANANDDSDDDRMAFDDARDEEITNQLLKSRRNVNRPLTVAEVDNVSRGRIDNLKGSVLSHVMHPNDVQYMDQMSQGQSAYSHRKRPQSRQVIFNSLVESQRSIRYAQSNVETVEVSNAQTFTNIDEFTRQKNVNSLVQGNAPSTKNSEIQIELESNSREDAQARSTPMLGSKDDGSRSNSLRSQKLGMSFGQELDTRDNVKVKPAQDQITSQSNNSLEHIMEADFRAESSTVLIRQTDAVKTGKVPKLDQISETDSEFL